MCICKKRNRWVTAWPRWSGGTSHKALPPKGLQNFLRVPIWEQAINTILWETLVQTIALCMLCSWSRSNSPWPQEHRFQRGRQAMNEWVTQMMYFCGGLSVFRDRNIELNRNNSIWSITESFFRELILRPGNKGTLRNQNKETSPYQW